MPIQHMLDMEDFKNLGLKKTKQVVFGGFWNYIEAFDESRDFS